MNKHYGENEDIQLEYEILLEMIKNNGPIGASLLAMTINSSQATIGRKLHELESKEYLVKQSNKGRTITEQGEEYFTKLKTEIMNAEKFKQLIDESKSISPKRLSDILRVRRILEKETVTLATQNITETEITQLEKIVNIQAVKVAQGFLGDEEDLTFHSSLAYISGNEVLEQIITLILTQNSAYSGFSYMRKKRPSSLVTDHKKIVQAIKLGDPTRAGEMMVTHIDNIINDMNLYFRTKEIEI